MQQRNHVDPRFEIPEWRETAEAQAMKFSDHLNVVLWGLAYFWACLLAALFPIDFFIRIRDFFLFEHEAAAELVKRWEVKQ